VSATGADVPDASRKIGASRRGAIGSSATADGKAVADRSRGWPIGAATAEVVEAGARATGAMATGGALRAGAGGGGGAAASSVVAYDRGSGPPGAKAGASRGTKAGVKTVKPGVRKAEPAGKVKSGRKVSKAKAGARR
jgi:hypothetical protein